MQKYKVINGHTVITPDEVTHTTDEVLELDPESDLTKGWLENGYIELVIDAPLPTMIDYVVVQGPFTNANGEVFQTGNAVQFPEGSELADMAIKEGLIMTKTDHDNLPKDQTTSSVGAPTTPTVAGNTEPRLRYRGKIVLVDGSRTVGAQTFHHIRVEDGSEYDLTDLEYQTEVVMAYPSQA